MESKTIRVRGEVYAALQQIAIYQGMNFSSPSDVIERLTQFWFEHNRADGRDDPENPF